MNAGKRSNRFCPLGNGMLPEIPCPLGRETVPQIIRQWQNPCAEAFHCVFRVSGSGATTSEVSKNSDGRPLQTLGGFRCLCPLTAAFTGANHTASPWLFDDESSEVFKLFYKAETQAHALHIRRRCEAFGKRDSCNALDGT